MSPPETLPPINDGFPPDMDADVVEALIDYADLGADDDEPMDDATRYALGAM
jgi:hypothetical protein